ncbi:MAG: hypothetical protein AAFY60_03165, partial [Myxococcota bacterium]
MASTSSPTRTEYNFAWLVDRLVTLGVLAARDGQAAKVKEAQQAARLKRAIESAQGRRGYRVSPPELLASFKLK